MATWTSLVVLSVAVVSTLSFPRPDAAYKIPTVGLGARAQYYVLHSDGTYKYGYDTADGIYEQAMAQTPGDVSGAFGYRDPTGADIKLEYTADDRGFLPRGSHLPVPPDDDFGARLPAAPTAYGTVSAPVAAPASVAVSVPVTPVEVAQVRSSLDDDGSYSFSYETSSSSRSESADAHNSVAGKYSFVADDGINRRIDYVAGSETGYIAEGDSLPVGPSVPGAESGIPTGRILPVLSEDEANALAAATSDSRPVPYGIGAGDPRGDASYSFSYDAGDSSRSESADANLNVHGTYSFIPPETNHRLTVNYRAGSDTGFVADGAHLPVPPEADFGSKVAVAPPKLPASLTKAAPTAYGTVSAPVAAPVSATPFEVAQVRSSLEGDGSYSFSYETPTSSRFESADAYNSVAGKYSFVADDGINRRIDYIAGSETGYIAEGDSLPVGPSVPGAESGIPTGRILPVLSEDEANALAAATSDSGPVTYGAGVPGVPSSSSSGDASYSFSYDAGDSSRSESADANLNVHGTYSFIPPETDRRLTINYRAGSDTGYITEGDSLPVGPSVPGAESGIPTGRILPVLSEGEANTLTAAGSSGVPDSAVVPYSAPPAPVVAPASGTKSSAPTLALAPSTGHTSQVVGDVLVHQYSPVNTNKYGYAFTALRR